MAGPPPNPDDYSAATTLIPFPRPLPLLRGPVKAGPYILAFKNPRAWAVAYRNCKAEIISQCESGSRIGCSISASNKCKPPWWKFLLGSSSARDFSERATCEEREMEACFVAAREKCGVIAKDKCEPAFMNARIEVGFELVGKKDCFDLISGVCFGDMKRFWGLSEIMGKFKVTNVRGRDLLGSDDVSIEDYLRKSS